MLTVLCQKAFSYVLGGDRLDGAPSGLASLHDGGVYPQLPIGPSIATDPLGSNHCVRQQHLLLANHGFCRCAEIGRRLLAGQLCTLYK